MTTNLQEKKGEEPGDPLSQQGAAEKKRTVPPGTSPGFAGMNQENPIHGPEVHQVGPGMQNEKLRKVRAAPEESHNPYLDLYLFAPVGYFTLNEKALITNVNHSGAALLGVERNDLVNHELRRFIPPRFHEVWNRFFSNVMNQREKQICTLTLTHSDGSMFPARLEGTSTTGDEGKTMARVTASDISDIRGEEEALVQAERKHRILIENSHDIIFTTSRAGIFTFVSPSWTLLLGHPVTQVIGRPFQTFLHPDDIPVCQAFFQRVIEMGQRQVGIEYRVLHTNGSWRWHSTNAVPICDEDGFIIGGEGTACDISERKVAEDAVRQSEQRYRTLFEQSSDSIFIADPKTRMITDCNRKAEQLTGYTRAELLSLQVDAIHPEDVRVTTMENFKKFIEGMDTSVDSVIITRDGRRVPVSILAGLVEVNNQTSLLGSFLDITRQKQVEEELRAANRKLSIISRINREDINSQLSALIRNLRILQRNQPGTANSEYLQNISDAARRISDMVRFTSDYEKVGVNSSVWQECHALVNKVSKQAPLANVAVKNDLPAGIEMFADPLINKVFYNLMDNAVRYGGKITTIRFSVEEHGDSLLIVCEDDGEGIPAGEKERIFERGFGKNAGMGLALSREILGITGISIRETGGPGKGARFEMTVPKDTWRMAGKRLTDGRYPPRPLR